MYTPAGAPEGSRLSRRLRRSQGRLVVSVTALGHHPDLQEVPSDVSMRSPISYTVGLRPIIEYPIKQALSLCFRGSFIHCEGIVIIYRTLNTWNSAMMKCFLRFFSFQQQYRRLSIKERIDSLHCCIVTGASKILI